MKNRNLLFKDTSPEDLEAILELEQDPLNKSFIYPYSMERHLEVIEREDEMHIKAIDPETGTIAGFMIFAKTEKETDSLELRRIVVKEKGKGFGRLCINWAKEFAFITHQANRLWLDVFGENFRAASLYESAGFIYEGTKRRTVLGNENWKNQHIYSILKGEFESSQIDKRTIVHNKQFKSISSTESSEVTGDTIFHYRQEGPIVWATYRGGSIRIGTLSGIIEEDLIRFNYQHLNESGEFRQGRCISKPVSMPDGRLRLEEKWEWADGISGESILEEIKINK